MLQIISTRRAIPRFLTAIMAGVFLSVGCGGEATPPVRNEQPAPIVVSEEEPAIRIVVLGDSLAAGLGLPQEDAFPSVAESLLRDRGFDVSIVNAGVSGDTSAGGLTRIAWVLQQPAEILVVELGGNDALRGQSLENTERNLREIIRRGREAGSRIVLLGMDVPTNYGPEYAIAFTGLYEEIADDLAVTLVPGFVRELASDPSLLQPDGLHPTREGQRRLAVKLLPFLADLLEPPQNTVSSSPPL